MNNKKQEISRLLTESAELLDEGAVSMIFKGVLIAPFILIGGLIGFAALYMKISLIQYNHKIKKESKNLTKEQKMFLISESQAITENYDKLIKLVKFAKYNPIAVSMMKGYMEFTKTYDKRLEEIDKEFRSIKSPNEFRKKKDYFIKKYESYNKDFNNAYKQLENKYKNINDNWVEGTDVIPTLTTYIKFFNDWDNMYYKNTDGDDYWESIDFLCNDEAGCEDTNDELWTDAYEAYSLASESGSERIRYDLMKEPFKYIKLQFCGDKPANN